MEDIHEYIEQAIGGDVRDPYPEFAQKRHETPVVHGTGWGGGGDVYDVYRYADVETVLREADTFASSIYAESVGKVFGPSILSMDGYEHRSHRGLIGGAFRRTALQSWEHTLIEPTVHKLIDGFAGRGSAELVREFTFPFPIQIIAVLLGIGSEDYDRFARLSAELISIATNIERGLAASVALKEFFAGVIQQRRLEPQDDVISSLVTAEIDGARLSDEEIYGFLRLLLPAGAETTFRLLGNLLFALLSNPDQLEQVQKDRALIAPAIEEALRWESPVQTVARGTTHATTLGDVDIPPGSHISLWLGSANRDETVFEDPDVFDIHRVGPPHLAFAEGPHRCLGEHLGRLETTVAMNAILDRLQDMRLAPGDWDPHVRGVPFRSPNAVPVVFTSS